MLKFHLLGALRTLSRHKLFTFLNILGLAIALGVFILIALYVEKEYSYDRHWQHADRMHWLTHESSFGATTFKNYFVAYPALDAVRAYFPEAIEAAARVMSRGGTVFVGDQEFQQNAIQLAEPEILDMLNVKVIAGSLEATFAAPGRIALSENLAERYFGTRFALDQVLTFEAEGLGRADYRVSAVFRDSADTSFRLAALALLQESALPDMADDFANWFGSARAATFFLLRDGVDVDALNARFPDFIDQRMPKQPLRVPGEGERMSDYHRFAFQHLPRAHFDEQLQVPNKGNEARVLTTAVVGALVLLMGGINFVILTTAQAEGRRRETGMRKVLGATRGHLIARLLRESILHALIALPGAAALVLLGLPFFERLVGRELALNLLDPAVPALLLSLAVNVGALGGAWPAHVVARFRPLGVLRPGMTTASARFGLRGVLVFVQFGIASSLIIATLVMYFQLAFLRDRDLGFDPSRVYVVGIYNQNLLSRRTPIVNELEAVPGVLEVATASRAPVNTGGWMMSSGTFAGNGREATYESFWVDTEFLAASGVRLLAGRFFDSALDLTSAGIPSSRLTRLVVNRKLSESLGFASPESAVGELIQREVVNRNGAPGTVQLEIIGVVENNFYRALREPVINEAYMLAEANVTAILVKYDEAVAASIPAVLESAWTDVAGDMPMRGAFLEQAVAEAFLQEENEGRLLGSLALLAIFIAGLGVFGLAAYTANRSVKEVGVRKVLGASSHGILLLFLWRFSRPVLLANLLAWPLAAWAMLRWLQRFPQQMDYGLLPLLCLAAAALSLLIAWLTVGATAWRAARKQPVQSLRYE